MLPFVALSQMQNWASEVQAGPCTVLKLVCPGEVLVYELHPGLYPKYQGYTTGGIIPFR